MDELKEALEEVSKAYDKASTSFPEGSLSRKLLSFVGRNIKRSKKLCTRIESIQSRAKAELSE